MLYVRVATQISFKLIRHARMDEPKLWFGAKFLMYKLGTRGRSIITVRTEWEGYYSALLVQHGEGVCQTAYHAHLIDVF